jgi:putative hydrolase of the HAD superfamily
MLKAVFWDFGGVILSSPFEAFNAYEAAHDIPLDFIRGVNATNPDDNAWAQIERRQVSHDEFDELFAAESEALGHRIRGLDVIGMLYGAIRPAMVVALDRVIAAGYVTACLTNNFATDHQRHELETIMARFDHVIESSKVGVRKPEPAFYEHACATAGVTPNEVVFLDDLGINLKPAKAMGMTTIKVTGGDQAIAELEAVLGITLR